MGNCAGDLGYTSIVKAMQALRMVPIKKPHIAAGFPIYIGRPGVQVREGLMNMAHAAELPRLSESANDRSLREIGVNDASQH